jgi:hypothetical protein
LLVIKIWNRIEAVSQLSKEEEGSVTNFSS